MLRFSTNHTAQSSRCSKRNSALIGLQPRLFVFAEFRGIDNIARKQSSHSEFLICQYSEILEQAPDLPSLEILRRVRESGYPGGKTALYALVASLRPKAAKPLIRFEGLAGEFSQDDFGQVEVEFVDGDALTEMTSCSCIQSITQFASAKVWLSPKGIHLTADYAHVLVQNVISGILKNENRMTRFVLAAVLNVNVDYRPDPWEKTANDLVRHIASRDNWFLKSAVDGRFMPRSVKIPEAIKTVEEVAA